MHSTASDGVLPPARVVELAKERGLLGMALTDHDTVDGLEEATAAGRRLDFTVIPGIELSAEYNDQDVHILGYWIDAEQMRAAGRLQQLSDFRTGRIYEIVRRLSLLGMELDAEAIVRSAGSSPGRPHVAAAMVEAGYVSDLRAAFAKWLGRGKPAYVPRSKLSPFEAVEMRGGRHRPSGLRRAGQPADAPDPRRRHRHRGLSPGSQPAGGKEIRGLRPQERPGRPGRLRFPRPGRA